MSLLIAYAVPAFVLGAAFGALLGAAWSYEAGVAYGVAVTKATYIKMTAAP